MLEDEFLNRIAFDIEKIDNIYKTTNKPLQCNYLYLYSSLMRRDRGQ